MSKPCHLHCILIFHYFFFYFFFQQQFDKTSVQPQDQVIFRPTQILPSDVSMKRYNQQGPPDFALNQFAGKRGRLGVRLSSLSVPFS
jgi:hypothetical protein